MIVKAVVKQPDPLSRPGHLFSRLQQMLATDNSQLCSPGLCPQLENNILLKEMPSS